MATTTLPAAPQAPPPQAKRRLLSLDNRYLAPALITANRASNAGPRRCARLVRVFLPPGRILR